MIAFAKDMAGHRDAKIVQLDFYLWVTSAEYNARLQRQALEAAAAAGAACGRRFEEAVWKAFLGE